MDNSPLMLVAPLVTIAIAVTTGLWRSINAKFKELSSTLAAHTNREELHNDKLAEVLKTLGESMVRLQAEKALMATTAQLNEVEKDLREEIVETRHVLRGEMQQTLSKVEANFHSELQNLKNR
jgi:hypothetical protein